MRRSGIVQPEERPQETHRPLRCLHLFLGERRRILDRLLDIFALQVRISFKNLLDDCAVSDLSDDHGNGNTHAADARSSTHAISTKVIQSNIKSAGQYNVTASQRS